MIPAIPDAWRSLLSAEVAKPYFRGLDAFLDDEVAAGKSVLPPRNEIFAALKLTAPEDVKVVLLGQDPYPTPGHAHGLCFSVRPDVRPIPGSLRNIYKELAADVGFVSPGHGGLETWAEQGILLLNTALTVRAGEANSHQKRGWEQFTTRVIECMNEKATRVVFVLWGRNAQQKRELITQPQHAVVECAHPSPLSARLFLGSRCFSQINRLLVESGQAPVTWQIPANDLLTMGR